MNLDGLTVSMLTLLGAVVILVVGVGLYALRLLRRTEVRQLTSLRDIIRLVYHGR